MVENGPRQNMLSCLISVDEETKLHIAHCLNFDLVECGQSEEEAWANLKKTVKQFVEYSYSNHQKGLSMSAEPEEWAEFAEVLKHSTQPPKVDKIDFDLKPPLPGFSAPIWMQGVSEDGTPCSQVQ